MGPTESAAGEHGAQHEETERAALPICLLGRALESFRSYRTSSCRNARAARPTTERLERSQSDRRIPDLARYQHEVARTSDVGLEKKDTVLYLAYGSNLAANTFQGWRGIRPLAQINVLVPELRMTFDIPGIPYREPCFANTARRDPTSPPNPPPHAPADYHKNRWQKGLVGVVYEVTAADFAHIIATEGGGSSYQDVLATCYPLEAGVQTVPDHPRTAPFKAHTLFAPYSPPASKRRGRVGRPDPAYAQASARYLALISGGAREHDLPREYLDYLDNIRPYTTTTLRQKLGAAAVMGTWGLIILSLLKISALFQDKKTGRVPAWLSWLSSVLFNAVWGSYDRIFKPVFGDGERTIGQGGGKRLQDGFSPTSRYAADESQAEKLLVT